MSATLSSPSRHPETPGLEFPIGLTTPANPKSQTVFHGALLLFALLLGFLLRLYGPDSIKTIFQPVALTSFAQIGLLIAAVVLAMLLHELGHLLTALALEFHFLGASVGPIRLQTLHGKWKWSLAFDRFFSASISASPSRLHGWRRDMLAVVAAGPLATFFTSLVGLYLILYAPISNPDLRIFLVAFVQMGLLLTVLMLIPNSSHARVRNDARMFLLLAGKSPKAEELELSVILTHLQVKGETPADYPYEFILRLARWRGRPEAELVFAQALIRWALDSEEWSLAETWDSRSLALSAQCNRRARNHVLAESGCLDLLLRNDLESARAKLAQVKPKTLFPKCLEHRAKAARLIALSTPAAAPAEIIRAQYALPLGIPAYNLERKLLANLHTRVLSTLRSPKGRSHGASAGA